MGVNNNVLPISNIINVTITNTPQGIAVRNANNLVIFTNEQPSNFDIYRSYVSASQVSSDYGTSSVTTAMANAIFAQSPNILSGNGQLSIVPMQSAVSATAGKVTTASLASNLSSIIAVTSGDLKVTINSVVTNLTKLNFTGATTLNDVATVIQAQLLDATITVVGNTLVFTSKKVGTTSTVALGAVSGGTGTDLSGAGYLNSAGSTAVGGTNSSGETVLAAIARVDGTVPFTGVMTTLNLEDTAISTIAAGIQARDNLFLHHASCSQDIAGIITTIKTALQTKTRILYYTTDLASANIFKAAYAGRMFSVNFTGSNTAATAQLKQLSNINPDGGINQTAYNSLYGTNGDGTNGVGADFYVSIDGRASIISTGGNDFFDNQYSNLALKFALTTAGFNFLAQTNTKVPQTENGMNGLKTAYAVVLEQFVTNGFIAAGSWTSFETVGNPEIFRQNILDKGYYIYSQPIVLQSSTDRINRKAPLVQIAVKRAGAIHHIDTLVNINP